jgi:hypothetical protein
MTPLVGRECEVRELEDRLRSGRLVIIQGPPGEGKSRLAAEVVRRLHAERLVAEARDVNLGGLACGRVGGWVDQAAGREGQPSPYGMRGLTFPSLPGGRSAHGMRPSRVDGHGLCIHPPRCTNLFLPPPDRSDWADLEAGPARVALLQCIGGAVSCPFHARARPCPYSAFGEGRGETSKLQP